MRPPLVAIFFMTNFYRAGAGHGPLAPLDPLLVSLSLCLCLFVSLSLSLSLSVLFVSSNVEVEGFQRRQ